jgi:glycosyltransferase involved in cell wall biosynthesis
VAVSASDHPTIGERRKVTVVGFDLSDNSTGRADLLARLLQPCYDVTVVGPRFGVDVWMPAREGPVAYRAVPGSRYPAFARTVPALMGMIDGDVVLASKPRPTSYGVALLARARSRRPLALDIDDWELGFFYRAGVWGTIGRALNVANPNGFGWTWLVESLVRRADAVTVASRFLQGRFGGTLIGHVRDTELWDPRRFDREAARARLGVGAARVVMFLGTPRGHKGVDDLVEAAAGLGPEAVLVLVGIDLDSEKARRWRQRPFVKLVGMIPFDDVPRYLIAADVVAIPQRDTPDTIGQVPAKLFDAMALGRPIVSTRVSMIPEILDGCGVVVAPGDVVALREALRALLDAPAAAQALGRRAREQCEAKWSFRVARAALFPVIERLLDRVPPPA